MARRKISKENIRKIQKSKGSYYVTIPIKYIRDFEWRERQKIKFKKSGKKLIIEDWEENSS